MSVAMEDWPRRHLITVDEFNRMAECGSFAPDARVELIDGEIIDMAPIGLPHAAVVNWLNEQLFRAALGRAVIQCQQAVQMGDISQPQPDLSLLVPREDYYLHKRPAAFDTVLAIEVSDTTLQYDLKRKKNLYSRHGIKEYWVLDVNSRQMHVFRGPVDGGYEQVSCLEKPGEMQIAGLPGVSVDLSWFFRED